MFDSLFADGVISALDVFICLISALVAGVLFAFMNYYRTKSTKSFLTATSLLPMVVALVIILVNGNVGTGIAIAGAFSLVRFRSAPGTAKEICVIFVAMAAGLAFGMGCIAYGVIFMIIAGAALMLSEKVRVFEKKVDIREKIIRITLPEDLDYSDIFDDIFEKYTTSFNVVKVKTINMGSMFKVNYHVILKDPKQEKEMIDEIRQRNGNLEVSVQRMDYKASEL